MVAGALALAVAAAAQAQANYARPFEPPTRPTLIALPPGAVEPGGWLRDWCLAARDGYTGHMDEVDDEFKRAWAADHQMTGSRLDWPNGAWPYEGGGYWFDGMVRLGYALHDDALIQQATNRMNVVVDNMTAHSILFLWWLDRNNAVDRSSVEISSGWPLWACGLMGRSLSGYYAASGNERTLQTLQTAYNGDPSLIRYPAGLSNPWPAFDTYTWTGNPTISNSLNELVNSATNSGTSAWDRYSRMPSMTPGAEPNDHVVHFLESTTPWATAYLWTGNTNYLQATLGWHDLLARDSMQPSGVPVADEYYGPTGAFRGTETCDVAGYVWSQLVLLGVTGEGRMADRAERAFFNAGPATVTRDFKKHVYFQSPNRFVYGSPDFPNGPRAEGGSYQTKHSPLCCTAALNRIVPWYVTHMWMATYDNGLAATCYGPCKVTAQVADHAPVEITCATDYPFNEIIDMTVTPAQETAFPLLLHIPGWCATPELLVNGSAVAVETNAHGFACISRLWRPGDTVRLSLPMTARVETGRDYNNGRSAPYASVSYGPLLFARAIPDTADANTPDPAARWKFALDVQDPNISVERQALPSKWDWPLDAPLKLQVRAVAADWNPDPGAPRLPDQAIVKQSPSEAITLIPYGCTKFRISMFPVTAATNATALSDSALLIDAHRTTNMAVNTDSALGTVINAGRIIKTGEARLTLTNAFLFNGTEEIKAGTLELGDGAGDLPVALRDSAGLSFWADANRNVATALDGTVTHWFDVRESEGGTTYPRARPYGSEPAPTLVTGEDDVAGLKLVDFGSFPSGKWLQWQNAGGYRNAIGNIRAVFLAVSCTNGTGFLLGDWTGSGWSGNYCFHVGGSFTDGLDATWWYPGASPDLYPVRWGLTFVNGILTDGMRQRVPHTGTVLSVQTVSGVLASNFCNDRNLKAGNWDVPADRQGGGRIGEALIYTSELTESQRKQVEAYLMKKWLRKSAGTIRVAEGATVSMSTALPPDLSNVTGAGTVDLSGTGQVALPEAADIAAPSLRLAAGVSVSGGLCRRPGQPFTLTGGAAYDVTDGVCMRTAQTDAGLASKTGSGTLTVSAIDEGVSRIAVDAGALRLSPPLPGTPDVLADAMGNGDFEAHDPVRSPDENGLIYIQNQTDTGWTYTFGASGTGNCGLALYGSAFCKIQPPDGDWALFLVNDCDVARTFTVPASGRYEVSFRTAATINSDWQWHLYQVLVDETNIVGSVRTSSTGFDRVACRTPALSAGAHTLRFRGLKEAGMNRVSLVDAVELRPCPERDEVAVPNGGFEAPTLLTEISSAERPYACFQHEPEGAGWTFSGTFAGTTEGYGTWRYAGMDEGGHAAVLCKYNGGVMSVPLTFPSAGHYRITFLAACRTARYSGYYNTWTDGTPFARVSVRLNDVEAAQISPTTGPFTRYEFVLPPVTGGALTQTLTFLVTSGETWSAALIDDVRVFRLAPLANPGFEDVTESGIGWSFDRGDWECGITTPGEHSWTDTSPEGERCLVLARNGRAWQTVTFGSSGTYEISFLAAQSPMVSAGHDFELTFGGLPAGYVRTVDAAFRRYAFRLPYVEAGQAYELNFQGLNTGGGWAASLIDSVILRKAGAEPAAFNGKAFTEASVSLAAGTRLEVDYGDVIELDGLSYDGVPRTGTLSAENTLFIRGAGRVLVKPKGAVLLLR